VAVLEAGQPVPEFELRTYEGDLFTRESLLGFTTLLVFYPFAFSPVCHNQLKTYQPELGDWAEHGVRVLAVSCDSVWSQEAFKQKLQITIPQLSDFEPKGQASRAFGVYRHDGFPERALLLVGPDGVVLWSHQAGSPGDLPEVELIDRALARL
jgi:mycoredoxin-dependent peroxiredoxin